MAVGVPNGKLAGALEADAIGRVGSATAGGAAASVRVLGPAWAALSRGLRSVDDPRPQEDDATKTPRATCPRAAFRTNEPSDVARRTITTRTGSAQDHSRARSRKPAATRGAPLRARPPGDRARRRRHSR